MMKAHIGKDGPGTRPICGSTNRSTSGLSVALQEFTNIHDAFRCERCSTKYPRLKALADKMAAKGTNHE